MMCTFLLCLTWIGLVPQDAGVAASPTSAEIAARAQTLKTRVHDMRLSLLTGGDLVWRAEEDAVDFYQSRIEAIDQALDSIHADLLEEQASYDLALDRALRAPDALSRKAGMADATRLGTRISFLEAEQKKLDAPRNNLIRKIDIVMARQRERTILATQFDSLGGIDDAMNFPMGGVGLAPDTLEEGMIISDGLIDDLLQRDPLRARRLLYETDPEGYWARFGLQPPTGPLLEALPFPSPDPPGRR